MTEKIKYSEQDTGSAAHVAAGSSAPRHRRSRSSPSLFGPIVLIAVGVGLLAVNFGWLPAINWQAMLRLWPVLLIFWGVNLIVRQVPRPFGSFLSALLGIAAVGAFVYVALFATTLPFIGNVTSEPSVTRNQPVSAALGAVEAAAVTIDFSIIGADLYALSDDDNLIDGTITYMGDLVFDVSTTGDRADVLLDTRATNSWFLDPANWTTFTSADRWQIGLNDGVVYDLNLDLSSGSTVIDLSALQVAALAVDGSSGSTQLRLPAGDYAVRFDGGSGSSVLTLGDGGRQRIDLEAGSGSVAVAVPDGVAARVEVDTGSGSFSADSRFTRVEQRGDFDVYETAGYSADGDGVLLVIDGASGSIRIESAGR